MNDTVYKDWDGRTVLASQVVGEAERALAEAASAARVDELRRAFDAAVQEHCMRFGFDPTSGVAS